MTSSAAPEYENQGAANYTDAIRAPTYENVEFGEAKRVTNEGNYTLGRRFPSFRMTQAQKKEMKKNRYAPIQSNDLI